MDTKQLFTSKLKQLMNDLGIKFYFGWEADIGFLIDDEEFDLCTISDMMPDAMCVKSKEKQEADDDWLARHKEQ